MSTWLCLAHVSISPLPFSLSRRYRPEWWYNQSFTVNGKTITTKMPADIISNVFGQALNVRWAGIRKPRTYSNVAFCNASGWLLPDSDSVGAGGNNWNYTVDAFRQW